MTDLIKRLVDFHDYLCSDIGEYGSIKSIRVHVLQTVGSAVDQW